MQIKSKNKMVKCEFCAGGIDTKKNKYVLLGTYFGKKTERESYFHFQCFKKKWENQVRLQAKNMVENMANKMIPMAKKIVGNITGVDMDEGKK